MTSLIRHFRGLGVALAVLALSASAVFATAPRFAPVSNDQPAVEQPTDGAGETDAPETAEPADTEAPETADPTDDATGVAPDSATQDTHGELVSTAAQMVTPAGFPNHGAFVSCVAHMGKDVVATGFDWTTVTATSCGITTPDGATSKADKGKAHSQAGNAHGQAGKTHGKATPGS